MDGLADLRRENPPSRLAICTTSRSLGDRRTWMSVSAPRYETNSTVPARLLSSLACLAASISSRSGRSDSVAGPWLAARAGDRETAFGAEAARRLDGAGEEGRAADEARDEAVGRPLVEIALAADLHHGALVHHHQPVGHGEGLLLVVRHHHRGEAELALQLADLHPHLLAQLGVEVARAARRAAARRAGWRAPWPAPPVAAGRPRAGAAGGRHSPRGGPATALPRPGGRCRPWAACASRGRTPRSRPPSCAGTARSSGTPCRHCASTGGRVVTSLPANFTCPAVGSMKPATMRKVVVLPQPEGPSSTRNSPSLMLSETSRTA